ncbi:conserved hypothetical protein, partial [delta proteobacterium NaphS2]
KQNWRGRPLDSLGTIINLISNTTTWPLTKTEPVLLIVTEPVIARCAGHPVQQP